MLSQAARLIKEAEDARKEELLKFKMKVPRPFAAWLLTLLLASLALEIAGQKLRDSTENNLKNDNVETFGGTGKLRMAKAR